MSSSLLRCIARCCTPRRPRHLYAVISHGGGLPTVVRLDAPLLGVGREFTEGDFARLFELNHERLATQIDGEARDLKWRLRASML